MASLESVLANIPGYGGYAARNQQKREEEFQDVKAVGALQQILEAKQKAQQATQDRARQEEFRMELQALGQNPTREQLATVGAKYAGPKELLTSQTASLDRSEAIAQRAADSAARLEEARERHLEQLNMRQQMLDLRRDQMSQAQLSAEQKRAFDEWYKRESLALRDQQNKVANEMREETLAHRKDVDAQRLANSPAAVKEREAKEGREQVTEIVKALYGNYKRLEELGADIDPSQSAFKNIRERIASSGVGQMVAGAVGTEAQTIRDTINAGRADLMAALKKATGMGATQLNSNIELQFYLKMATDPSMGRWANRAALAKLDRAFGLGVGITSDPEDIARLEAMFGKQSSGAVAPAVAPQPSQNGWSIRPVK